MSGPSILELLHPEGRCRRALVLGSGCPQRLRPAVSRDAGELDLVVVAPDAHEIRDPTWLDKTASSCAGLLARDGLLCAFTPPQHRGRLTRLLSVNGLDPTCAVLYRSRATGEDNLLPLRTEAIQHEARAIAARPTRVNQLKGWLLSQPGAIGILRRWHRGTFIVGRQPGARPLSNWLLEAITDNDSASTALIDAKWRQNRGSVVLRALSPRGQIAAIAKLTLGELEAGRRVHREADLLKQVAGTVRGVGISIPEGRVLGGELGLPVLLQTVVPGDSAAALLAAQRISSLALLATLSERLLAWNRKTCIWRTIDPVWIEREVLRPAAAIVPLLKAGETYVSWLQGRCHELTGHGIPLVMTHGDLTMWNVLVNGNGSLGIVDWEGAAAEGLPLGDFCYAALDVTAATHHYKDRVDAFIRCFEGSGPEASRVARLRTALSQALGLTCGVALLCFHACWLQHASAELKKRGPMEPHPFRDIVGRLASRPESFGTTGLTA